jgi:hypothetical protein
VGNRAAMTETFDLKPGQERPVKLPPAEEGAAGWTYEVRGMASAVEVQKMWTSDPYPEDDEEVSTKPRYMVFMIRGRNPGRASVRFYRPGTFEGHTVDVVVRS